MRHWKTWGHGDPWGTWYSPLETIQGNLCVVIQYNTATDPPTLSVQYGTCNTLHPVNTRGLEALTFSFPSGQSWYQNTQEGLRGLTPSWHLKPWRASRGLHVRRDGVVKAPKALLTSGIVRTGSIGKVLNYSTFAFLYVNYWTAKQIVWKQNQYRTVSSHLILHRFYTCNTCILFPLVWCQ